MATAFQIRGSASMDVTGVEAGFRKIQHVTNDFKRNISGINSQLAGFLAVGGLLVFAKSTVEAGAHTVDLSRRLQVSTTTMQRFDYAAKQTGSDVEALTKGVLKASANIALGGLETAKYQKALALVGLESRNLLNLSPDEFLLRFAEAFAKTSNRANANAAAVTIFGNKLQSLLPLLALGREGIEELWNETPKASEETLQKLKQMSDDMTKLTTTLKVLASEVLSSLRPVTELLSEHPKLVATAFQGAVILGFIALIGKAHASLTGLAAHWGLVTTAATSAAVAQNTAATSATAAAGATKAVAGATTSLATAAGVAGVALFDAFYALPKILEFSVTWASTLLSTFKALLSLKDVKNAEEKLVEAFNKSHNTQLRNANEVFEAQRKLVEQKKQLAGEGVSTSSPGSPFTPISSTATSVAIARQKATLEILESNYKKFEAERELQVLRGNRTEQSAFKENQQQLQRIQNESLKLQTMVWEKAAEDRLEAQRKLSTALGTEEEEEARKALEKALEKEAEAEAQRAKVANEGAVRLLNLAHERARVEKDSAERIRGLWEDIAQLKAEGALIGLDGEQKTQLLVEQEKRYRAEAKRLEKSNPEASVQLLKDREVILNRILSSENGLNLLDKQKLDSKQGFERARKAQEEADKKHIQQIADATKKLEPVETPQTQLPFRTVTLLDKTGAPVSSKGFDKLGKEIVGNNGGVQGVQSDGVLNFLSQMAADTRELLKEIKQGIKVVSLNHPPAVLG